MIDYATPAEWHAWLRENWAPDPRVLAVLMNDFEKETKKLCPERLNPPTLSEQSLTVTS
jgi:hypothetical protein